MIFEKAYQKTAAIEGGYANNSADKGGETYCGISRRFWPRWEGWTYIDKTKAVRVILHNEIFPELADKVKLFYRTNFWYKIKGDYMTSEKIAEEVYDGAVNCGVHEAAFWLQKALNVLNREATLWPDIKVDGIIGSDTIHKLQTALTQNKEANILKCLQIQRGFFYFHIAYCREDQEIWLENWLSRLS